MAIFKTVDGATLKSISWEAALLEAATQLEEAISSSTNATEINFVGTVFNDAANTVSITANLPIEFNRTEDGTIAVNATSFVTASFTNGGDVKSATLPSALLEIAQTIKNLEENYSVASRVELTYNSSRKFVAITATLPVIRKVATDGSINIFVSPYLGISQA